MSEEQTLARTAASRFGLLTTSELKGGGIDGRQRTTMVDSGALHRVRRGFYTRGPTPPTWLQQLAAAQVHLGDQAVVSHRAAARLHGLRSDDELDFTVPYPHKLSAAGVAVHRSRDLDESDCCRVDGFMVTVPVRTLCDLGLVLPPTEVERTVDHSIATGAVTTSELQQLRERVGEHGRNGVGAIDAALALMPADALGSESGPELKLFKELCRSSLPPPERQYPVRACGRSYRLDFAYPACRVGIEFDGAEHHSSPSQLRADAVRQRHLESAGWLLLRFRWDDLRPINIPGTLAQIREALRHRGGAHLW